MAKPPPGYDARGLTPDAARMGEAHHVRRDPITDEISWPPDTMAAILRDLQLIDEKDGDHDTWPHLPIPA